MVQNTAACCHFSATADIIPNLTVSKRYSFHNTFSWKKNYDYRNSWNLIKTTIIVIISKSGQGKTYNE